MALPAATGSARAAADVEVAIPESLAPAPIRAGLGAAVVELERMAAEAQALQDSLSPLLLRSRGGFEGGQELDALTQHLQGLADFLAAMARDCPLEWRFDQELAGDPLRLHAQKLRLVYGSPTEAPPATAGEVELW